jgi:hypothetical protein
MKRALAPLLLLTSSVTSSAQDAKLRNRTSSVWQPGHGLEPNRTVRFWTIRFSTARLAHGKSS